ncbi:Heterokaryon incompatibility protein s [Colletotrichum fructicola]|nr:Heterokaryon incompatibility protein s [Colletotrichum fructicola]
MEPIGLAVGIAGLAGLFSTCVDVVERMNSYRDFKHDSHSLYVEFEAEKRRFEQWGSATGINKSALSSAHHPALDDPQTLSTAKDLLSLIHNLYTDTDDAAAQPFLPGNASTAKDEPSVARHVQPSRGAANSVRRKLFWSLWEKKRHTEQVKQFGVLVQHLHNILPPDGAKSTYAVDVALVRDQGLGRLQGSFASISPDDT